MEGTVPPVKQVGGTGTIRTTHKLRLCVLGLQRHRDRLEMSYRNVQLHFMELHTLPHTLRLHYFQDKERDSSRRINPSTSGEPLHT